MDTVNVRNLPYRTVTHREQKGPTGNSLNRRFKEGMSVVLIDQLISLANHLASITNSFLLSVLSCQSCQFKKRCRSSLN